MKFILLLFFLLMASASGYCQWSKFIGDWQGKITMGDGSTVRIRFKITSEGITQYFRDDNDENWSASNGALAKVFVLKDNMVFFWMNNGEIWTESQTFMLSYTNSNKLYLVWSRQVVNERSGQSSNFWSKQGEGSLINN